MSISSMSSSLFRPQVRSFPYAKILRENSCLTLTHIYANCVDETIGARAWALRTRMRTRKRSKSLISFILSREETTLTYQKKLVALKMRGSLRSKPH